ncbi:hypothetical protein AB8A20_11675 [Tardiphaga sp. 604_B6_N1_1]|uniref:hypothetical protein n=1 Tax=Tardiphaga sp. 604_B6_N1_1 TaxID=3240779 RepID=UPI003F220208
MILSSPQKILKQWDAFFKEIAPLSNVLRVSVARCLRVREQDLLILEEYPAEYRSRSIADALHHNGIYKEFRLDGLYRTTAFRAFGYEYQRTYNNGVPLRTLMYEIAIREKYPDLDDGDVRFVVLYSGRGLADATAEKYHGKRIGFFTTARLIDLNRLDMSELISSDLYSFILALARNDAPSDLFLSALTKIDEEAVSLEQADRLKKAVLSAASGQYEALKLLRDMTMDSQIRENLNLLFEASSAQRTKDFLMTEVAKASDVPGGVLETIENWELNQIEVVGSYVFEAMRSNDWSVFNSLSYKQS